MLTLHSGSSPSLSLLTNLKVYVQFSLGRLGSLMQNIERGYPGEVL